MLLNFTMLRNLLALALFGATAGHAQVITTIAGTGSNGSTGDGGQATAAQIGGPAGVAIDASGNVYIASCAQHRIRRVTPTGVISTIAGTGVADFSGDGGLATAATVSCPATLKFDSTGNLFFTDYGNHRIRRISNTGVITTVAGNGTGTFAGDGGAAISASLRNPVGIDVDANGALYIGDTGNHRVRYVTPGGTISTIAGTGAANFSGDGGSGTNATLNLPAVVRVDASGNLFIADRFNHRVRMLTTAGIISTVVGNGSATFAGDGGSAINASLNGPYGLALASNGDLYIGEVGNARVRRVSGGIISTIAGNGVVASNGDGGVPLAASIHPSIDLVLDAAGNLIFPEQNFHRVRKLVANAPAAPLMGTAVAGLNSVTVNFTRIDTHSGPLVISHTASCGTFSANGAVSPIVLTGLPSGQTVTCTVTATNVIGTSAPSTASNSVTPTGAPVFTANTPPRYVVLTEFANYNYRSSALPAATLQWQSGTVPPGTNFSSGSNNVLQMNYGVTTRGDYTYTIRATNTHGFVDTTHTTSVVVRASPPTITSLTRGSGTVTVNFTPPADNGGSPVQWYEVYCSAYSVIVGGNLSSATVAVPDNVSGECVMLAYTAARQSFNSASALFYPFGAPGAPTAVNATAGALQLSLSFTPPADSGTAPITSYNASCSNGVTATGAGSPLLVSGLILGNTYSCTVTAINANGAGPPSTPSNAVTIGLQTIIFGAAPSIPVYGTGSVAATGGASGNPVIFTSTTPAVCTTSGLHGATVTNLTPGTCVIAANQAGSTAYTAAPQVTQSIVINALQSTTSLATARADHTATRMADGRVLVVAGVNSAGIRLASAEIYDPVSSLWSVTGGLTVAREEHTATRLADGRVLVVGGLGGSTLSSAEVFNPATNLWSATGALATARRLHTATLLNDGRVLVTGGFNGASLGSTEIFDPATNTWSSAGALAYARMRHTATVVSGVDVLVIGGDLNAVPLTSIERYNPATNIWSPAGTLNQARTYHTATMLPNGQVLIAGGDAGGALASVERFDPSTNTLSAGASLTSGRYRHSATLLSNGRVLVAGQQRFVSGATDPASLEMYDYLSNSWTAAGNLAAQRHIHTATLLGDGRVLFAAGRSAVAYFNSAELFVLPPLPAAPTIGSASAGNASATVTFNPAYHIGLTPLQGFTATSSPGGFTGSCVPPCTSINVTGLANGTAYTFTVTATNGNGVSAASAASNSVTTPAATTLQLFTSGTPSFAGNNVTFTAVISPNTATGTVAFNSNAAPIAGCTAVTVDGAGNAACNTIFNSIGIRAITASYAGDAAHNASNGTLTGGQEVIAPTITITPDLPDGATNVLFGPVQLLASGGVAPHQFTVTTGSLPNGLNLSSSGLLSGTPNLRGSYNFTVTTTDANGFTGARVYDLTMRSVPDAPTIGLLTAGDGSVTISFTAPLIDGGSPITIYNAFCSFAASSPTSPITLNGLPNGVPVRCRVNAINAIGSGAVSEESNEATPQAPTTMQLQSSDTPAIAGVPVTFTATLAPTSATGSVVFAADNVPLSGCSSAPLAAGSAVCNATFTTAGNRVISASYSGDAAHITSSATLAGGQTVIAPTMSIATNLNDGAVGNAYGPVQLIVSGGVAPYSLAVTTGSLPNGLSLSNAGVLSGTPSTAAVANFTVTATDANNFTGTRAYSLPILDVPNAPLIISATPLDLAARLTFNASIDNGGSVILDYTASCTPGPISNTQNALVIDVVGLSNNTSYRCSVRARNAVGLSAPSAELSVIPGSSGSSADLSISKTNNSTFVNGGAYVDYTITVTNPGPAAVISARVEDAIGAGTDFSAALWTCTPLNNAACPNPASGSGSLDAMVDLPATSSVQFAFSASPNAGSETPISNTASVTPPANITDANLNNNIASDGPDIRGVFRSGFE